MSNLIRYTLDDEQRFALVNARIQKRIELRQTEEFYSQSNAYSQDPNIFQLTWCETSRPFDRNCPPVGSSQAFYNHSQMEDVYGGRWVAIEPPTEGREDLFWDTIMHTSQPQFWEERRGSVIIDLSFPQGEPLPQLLCDRFQYSQETEIEKYGCHLTTGTVDGNPVTHLHYKHWRNGKTVTLREHKEALFKLGWAMSYWMDSHQVSLGCLKCVGRTGALSFLTTMFRALRRNLIPVDLTIAKSALPPLVTEDTLAIENDRLCEFRASAEEAHHFTLVKEGLEWYRDSKLSDPDPLPAVTSETSL